MAWLKSWAIKRSLTERPAHSQGVPTTPISKASILGWYRASDLIYMTLIPRGVLADKAKRAHIGVVVLAVALIGAALPLAPKTTCDRNMAKWSALARIACVGPHQSRPRATQSRGCSPAAWMWLRGGLSFSGLTSKLSRLLKGPSS